MPEPSASTSLPNSSEPSPSPTVDPSASPPLTAPSIGPRVIEHPRPIRAGDMSLGWRAVTAMTWICVILALAAVWNASVQLGLSTWWLGPRSAPQSRIVQVSPFVAPVLMVLAAVNQVRWLPAFGFASAGVLAAVGFGDLGRVTSLAAVEFVIAAAATAVSIASMIGVYRRTAGVDRNTTAAAGGQPPNR